MLLSLLTKRYPGMRAWLTQRLSGLLLAIYSILFLIRVLVLQPTSYEAWLSFNQPWWWRIASWLFWLSLSVHAWLGVRDVLKDYVPNMQLRMVLLKLVLIMIWVYLAWITFLLGTI
jgi:succinate dehydrogenase / fumarate reductase membrane anchor subunit